MITYEQYVVAGGKYTEEEFNEFIDKVTMDINTLTFNRITDFNELTPFQQNIVTKVIVDMIDFNVDYEEVADVVWSSYSINGVSMTLDNTKIENVNGVIIRKYTLGWLEQTGLMCRVV